MPKLPARSRSGGDSGLKVFFAGIFTVVFAILVWFYIGKGTELQTSTLRTSFTKLNSTPVEFTIPEAGKLVISIGPSAFLEDAVVFGLLLSQDKGFAKNKSAPFQVDSAHTVILNATSSQNSQEYVLAVKFPQEYFKSQKTHIAELLFSTTEEGQFEIKGIYFGTLPMATFPPFQEFSIFIESANILFDAKGAARTGSVIIPPPSQQKPACSDKADNDGDKLIDYPDDPGCENAFDADETNVAGVVANPLSLDLPNQFVNFFQTPDFSMTEIVVIPLPAQEQRPYEFTLKAKGGKPPYKFSVKGGSIPGTLGFLLRGSGLQIKESGALVGLQSDLKAGHYRYSLQLTDAEKTLDFVLQAKVLDALGNDVGTPLKTSFQGTEHKCFVSQICEAFFKAEKGVEPYQYRFSGESPSTTSIFQINAGQAFYRFTPAEAQIGKYKMVLNVFDSSTVPDPADPEKKKSQPNKTTLEFTLVIEKAPAQPLPPPVDVPTSFKFSAEKSCEFLDISAADDNFAFIQFVCKNDIMTGSQGMMRPKSGINRAEAAKITTLIFSSQKKAQETYAPFQFKPAGTAVNYRDVLVSDWFAPYVYFLFQEGIVANKPLFRPSEQLTAAEAMKLVIEAYASLSPDVNKELETLQKKRTEWYIPYQIVARYAKATIGRAAPASIATREQVAELLYQLSLTYPVEKLKN